MLLKCAHCYLRSSLFVFRKTSECRSSCDRRPDTLFSQLAFVLQQVGESKPQNGELVGSRFGGHQIPKPILKGLDVRSGVAQWLACWAHNPKVCGSKPRSAILRGMTRSSMQAAHSLPCGMLHHRQGFTCHMWKALPATCGKRSLTGSNCRP